VGHLNELQEKYGEQGLSIVAVSKEDSSSLEKFIEELGAEFPIVAEKTNSMRAYGKTSYPSSFLIGPDGRVLWEGHPGNLSDATLEEFLSNVKILPAFPDALQTVERAFRKDKYADALKKLQAALDRGSLEEEDAATGEEILAWLDWYATSSLESAAADVREEKYYEASVTYELIQDLYKGHDYAEQADAALKELLSDADRKLEVKAGRKLAAILAEIREEDLSPKKALKALQPLLTRKYENTRAGQQAAELAAELEEEIGD
jgi:hypothetical protein